MTENTPHSGFSYTQRVVESYLEDDMVYKIIGFTKDNLYAIITVSIAFLIAFFIGRSQGIRAFSVIRNMKEKFENIEQKKKQVRKTITLLTTFEGILMKLIYAILLGELALLGNVVYVHGFDYYFFFRNSLTRTLMISLFSSIFVILFIKKIASKTKLNKVRHYRSIDQGVDEIGKELLENLGPELVAIIKVKLLGYQVKPTRASSTQTITIEQPIERKPSIVGVPQEKVNERLMKQATKYEMEKGILIKDLDRHKAFMQQIVSFEWCDYCSSLGAQTEEEKEKEEEPKVEEAQPERKEDPEVTTLDKDGTSDETKAKSGDEAGLTDSIMKRKNKHINADDIPTCCTNDCLRKYFVMGYEVGEQFQKEDIEMKRLKAEYNKIAQALQ